MRAKAPAHYLFFAVCYLSGWHTALKPQQLQPQQALSALIESALEDPSLMDVAILLPTQSQANLTKAFELAEKELGVPTLLDARVLAKVSYCLCPFYL